MLFKKLFLAIALVFSCSFVGQASFAINYLSPSEFYIAGVQPGMYASAVLQSFGEPTKRYVGDNIPTRGGPMLKHTNKEIWFYKGLGLVMTDVFDYPTNYGHRVMLVLVTDRSATTAAGLAVGDSIDQMVKLYGNPLYASNSWGNKEVVESFGPKPFIYDHYYTYRINTNSTTEWNDWKNINVYTYEGYISAICLYTGF